MSPFWRREKPLHEQLAARGGLALPGEATRDVAPWHQAGVHGVPRPREFDAVVSLDVADVGAAEFSFVALSDGTLVLESDVDVDLDPFADSLEETVDAPYRATAVRKGDSTWALAANRIRVETIEDDIDGDSVELAVRDGEQTLLVDGARAFGSPGALTRLAAELDAYVLRAERIDGNIWEVRVHPL